MHSKAPWTKYTSESACYVLADDESTVATAVGQHEANENANAYLIALAPTAPHDCEIPDCPGAKTKRLLEAAEGLREALEDMTEAIKRVGFSKRDSLYYGIPWGQAEAALAAATGGGE
jgi:hypothetical protein